MRVNRTNKNNGMPTLRAGERQSYRLNRSCGANSLSACKCTGIRADERCKDIQLLARV